MTTTARDVICKALNDGHDVDGILAALAAAGMLNPISVPRCPRCGWRSSVYETLPAPPSEDKP